MNLRSHGDEYRQKKLKWAPIGRRLYSVWWRERRGRLPAAAAVTLCVPYFTFSSWFSPWSGALSGTDTEEGELKSMRGRAGRAL